MNKVIDTKVFDEFPELQSDRLVYREFKLSDARDLFFIRSNNEVMNYMDTAKHQTVRDSENMIGFIHESFKEKKGINWVIVDRETNEFVGYFGFWRLMPESCRAEIGYALKPEYWGKGLMTESFKTLVDFAFNDLKVHSIEANVNPQNVSSMKVLEKAGFKKEAYFRENYLYNGEFIDSIIYSILETDVRG